MYRAQLLASNNIVLICPTLTARSCTRSCGRSPPDGQLLTQDQVGSIADAINARAVSPRDMPSFLRMKPKALMPRHINRPPLTCTLVSHHASVNQTRALAWRARHSVAAGGKRAGKKLPPQLMSMLESSSVHLDKLPAVMFFYPGIPYRFVSNNFAGLGQQRRVHRQFNHPARGRAA